MSLSLTLATPEKPILEEKVKFVDVPTVQGYAGIRPGHTSLISIIDAGVLKYGNDRDNEKLAAVDGGFLEVSDDNVTLIADEAFLPGGLDAESLKELIRSSQAVMDESDDAETIEKAIRDRRKAESWLALTG